MQYVSFFILLLASFGAYGAPLARINGQELLEEDLSLVGISKNASEAEKKAGLERLILYKLALQEARRQKIDQTPAYKKQADRLLYRQFLNNQTKQHPLGPSMKELSETYNKSPEIRARMILLYARNSEEKALAEKNLKFILQKLKEGFPFRNLAIKFSQDSTARLAGDLDYRGRNRFPKDIYEKTLKLKKDEVSTPIRTNETIRLVQLMDIKPFNTASSTYLAFLRNELKNEKEKLLLTTLLEDLKKNSKIEIAKTK